MIFLGMTPKAKATKEKKLDASEYIKTKNFCVKPTIIRAKKRSIEWEQIFPIYIPDNGSVQLLSRVRLFATLWTAAQQASLSITNSWSPPKPMSIESVMPPNHLILLHPLLLLPSIFPSIRVFSNELALRIRWPKYWSFISRYIKYYKNSSTMIKIK